MGRLRLSDSQSLSWAKSPPTGRLRVTRRTLPGWRRGGTPACRRLRVSRTLAAPRLPDSAPRVSGSPALLKVIKCAHCTVAVLSLQSTACSAQPRGTRKTWQAQQGMLPWQLECRLPGCASAVTQRSLRAGGCRWGRVGQLPPSGSLRLHCVEAPFNPLSQLRTQRELRKADPKGPSGAGGRRALCQLFKQLQRQLPGNWQE